MQAAVKKPLKEDIVSMGGMIGGESKKLHALREQGKNICGDVVSKAIAYAVGVLEVNASMGLIVAAPTAGSSGVIPGTLCALQEQYGFTDDEICQALFNAAAIGYLITRNATTAGAEGGCQAEVGVACAMAAGGLAELYGLNFLEALRGSAWTRPPLPWSTSWVWSVTPSAAWWRIPARTGTPWALPMR